MRVCLICEGSYPFIPGGVSSWVQTLVTQFKEIEFVIWAIATTTDEMSEYAYDLPENVKEVRTLYLGDAKWKRKAGKVKLTQDEKETLKSLLSGSIDSINWTGVLDLAKRHHSQMSDLLMSESFFEVCKEEYCRQHSKKVFLQFLWNFRGIYFPLMYILSQDIPKADVYHAVSAGYAGILGSCASYIEGAPFLLSEHGIYTREREEDIIRSNWVAAEFKELWIDFFKKLSFIAYQQASLVTTLFETNQSLQIDLKCPPEKIVIVPNGVNTDDFASCRATRMKREQSIDKNPGSSQITDANERNRPFTLGAVLRVVPIKDVKTMLLAFDLVNQQLPNTHLKIMGNCSEDPAYYRECLELLAELKTKNVEFTGLVNIKEHLPNIDLLLLSSISEGQPLAILEGMAAQIPFVATNVGDCQALLKGEKKEDSFGPAGIIVPVMDSEAMAKAILYCLHHPGKMSAMGKAGYQRVEKYYTRNGMLDAFHSIYNQLGGNALGRNRI